jgi:hypothetical protein
MSAYETVQVPVTSASVWSCRPESMQKRSYRSIRISRAMYEHAFNRRMVK